MRRNVLAAVGVSVAFLLLFIAFGMQLPSFSRQQQAELTQQRYLDSSSARQLLLEQTNKDKQAARKMPPAVQYDQDVDVELAEADLHLKPKKPKGAAAAGGSADDGGGASLEDDIRRLDEHLSASSTQRKRSVKEKFKSLLSRSGAAGAGGSGAGAGDSAPLRSASASSPSSSSSATWATPMTRVLPKWRFAPGIDAALIDVGTNADPDFAPYVQKNFPRMFYIGVEPLVHQKAEKACSKMRGRCAILPAAVFNSGRYTAFHVGRLSACSSILGGGIRCGSSSTTRLVRLVTLDMILDSIPAHIPVFMVALDCQGSDFYAAASLKRHRERVANMIAECQDFPLNHSMMIYKDARARNCGQLIACVTQQWGWVFVGCTINYPGIREFNCVFNNPRHRLADSTVRHPHDTKKPVKIKHHMKCPAKSWNAAWRES